MRDGHGQDPHVTLVPPLALLARHAAISRRANSFSATSSSGCSLDRDSRSGYIDLSLMIFWSDTLQFLIGTPIATEYLSPMNKSLWRILLFLCLTSILLAISWPWSKFDGTPHWDNIQWIPFDHLSFHPTMLFETAANVLVFIPVGYLMIRSLSPGTRHPILLSFLLGLCSSVSVEFYQLFCHDRVPAATDLITNAGGTGLGAWTALRVDQLLSLRGVRLRRISS